MGHKAGGRTIRANGRSLKLVLSSNMGIKTQVGKGFDPVELPLSLTGTQLRAARGLLNLSIEALAQRSGLAANTIRRAEARNGPAPITKANVKLVRGVLEEEGVLFIDADGEFGAGVRLRDPEPPPFSPRRRKLQA